MAVELDSGIAAVFFHDLHNEASVKASWEKVYRSMIVHTRGASPGDLLKKQRPNEPEDILEYRIANYRPITQDAINRGIDSLYRVVSESNYSITYSDNIADYLKNKLFKPEGYSGMAEPMKFMQLMLKYIIRIDIDDPNGALVWMPVNPVDPKEEPSKNTENKPTEIKTVIVNSSKIVHRSDGAFAWEAKNVWIVKNGQGEEVAKPFFYLITLSDIYRVIPTREAKSDDPREQVMHGFYYEPEHYYSLRDNAGRERDMLPVVILGGNSVLNEEGDGYYQSFFSGYVAWGDEAITSFSDNQAVRVRCNFPIPEEKGQKCATCKGSGEVNSGTPGQRKTCSTCSGTGLVPSRGPYSTYINEPPNSQTGDVWPTIPAIQWHTPPVENLRESFATWEKFIDKAERSINIKFIEEAQSGVAKEVDRDKLYDMLLKFSDNLFNNIIANSLDIILAYRVTASSTRKPSVVNPPNSFDIKSQKDLMEEIKDLSTSGAPTPFIANTAKQLAGRVFHGDKVTVRIIELQAEYDPFFGKSYAELISFESAGQLSREDIPRHNYAYQIIREVAEEKGDNFLAMPFSEVKRLADEKLEKLLPPEPVNTPFRLYGEEIISKANNPA